MTSIASHLSDKALADHVRGGATTTAKHLYTVTVLDRTGRVARYDTVIANNQNEAAAYVREYAIRIDKMQRPVIQGFERHS